MAFVEYMLRGESPLLWGDTINSNIDRYFSRYFMPTLKQLPSHWWSWNGQKKELKVRGTVCDFRSADRPENWEGFGYKNVFLNEAGIILYDPYLYENSVKPMLLDFPDSRLIAAGVPKGKVTKHGEHTFFKLAQQAAADTAQERYRLLRYTTYDNPFLEKAEIDKMQEDMPEAVRKQEIYGEFIDEAGTAVRRDHIRYGEAPDPATLNITMGVDLAISEKTKADYTAAVVVGRDEETGQVFILDAKRIRAEFQGILSFIKAMAEVWQPREIAIENVQFQAAVIQEMRRTSALPIRSVRPDKDKRVRFMPLQTRYEQGLVYHTQRVSADFEKELLSFPEGAHDDMIDAAAYAFALQNKQQVRIFTFD
jgi:predicted phage terminase large subunit-like protein